MTKAPFHRTVVIDQVDAMRLVSALVGVFFLVIQANSALAIEVFDKKSLEKFDSIDANHPDFKLKVSACYMFDRVSVSLIEKNTGEKIKSIIFKDDYVDTYKKIFRDFLGDDASKYLNRDEDNETFEMASKLHFSQDRENLGFEAIRRVCRKALTSMIIIMTNNSWSNPSPKSANSDAHSDCLEARDYEGCVKVKRGQSSANNSDTCKPLQACKAGQGNDMLGRPMITGWDMINDPAKQRVAYRNPNIMKVNVRGKTDRYIVEQVVIRSYEEPRAGSPGSTTSIGSARTDCTDYGSSISCTTTPATTISMPGISARPGGVVQDSMHILIDCKDRTVGYHVNGRLSGKWRAIEEANARWANHYCPIINTLELSTFDKYSK